MNQQLSEHWSLEIFFVGQCNLPSPLVADSRDTGQLVYPWLTQEPILSLEGSGAVYPAAEGILDSADPGKSSE